MTSRHACAMLLGLAIGCRVPAPAPSSSLTVEQTLGIPVGMDSASVDSLCQQPDSVRAGRAPCRLRERPGPHSYVPPEGYVPDSATAARIAEAVWIPIYGERQIREQRPYVARLHGEVWTVLGSFPPLPPGELWQGGVAEAEISKRDGRILRVSHGR